jgi:hypothetical protein
LLPNLGLREFAGDADPKRRRVEQQIRRQRLPLAPRWVAQPAGAAEPGDAAYFGAWAVADPVSDAIEADVTP